MSSSISLVAADGHNFSAWEAGSSDAAHAVVVVQEIFGVNHNIRTVAEEFAGAGFSVVAPALFDRVKRDVVLDYSPADVAEGLALRAEIPLESSLADLSACVRHLRRHDPARRIGIVGFCWGGTLAWDAATRTDDFTAVVAWYGGGIAARLDATPHCPIQLHFGDRDSSIPHQDVSAIRAAHPEVEIYVYDEAGHGFGNRDRTSFNADANHLAWQRTVAFLEAGLRQG